MSRLLSQGLEEEGLSVFGVYEGANLGLRIDWLFNV